MGFSDHSLSYLSWKVKQMNNTNNYANVIMFRKTSGVDIDAFKDEMRSQNWSEVEECGCLDDAVSQWEKLVMEVVDKHMPVRVKRVKKKHSPWINEFIFELMKKRDKSKKNAKLHNKVEDWREYKKIRNKVTLEIKKGKVLALAEQ